MLAHSELARNVAVDGFFSLRVGVLDDVICRRRLLLVRCRRLARVHGADEPANLCRAIFRVEGTDSILSRCVDLLVGGDVAFFVFENVLLYFLINLQYL